MRRTFTTITALAPARHPASSLCSTFTHNKLPSRPNPSPHALPHTPSSPHLLPRRRQGHLHTSHDRPAPRSRRRDGRPSGRYRVIAPTQPPNNRHARGCAHIESLTTVVAKCGLEHIVMVAAHLIVVDDPVCVGLVEEKRELVGVLTVTSAHVGLPIPIRGGAWAGLEEGLAGRRERWLSW